MLITYLKDEDLLKIEAEEIVTFIDNIEDYSNITMIGASCCIDKSPLIYNTTEVLDTSSTFYISDNILYVKPTYFGLTSYKDGIYKVSLKFTTNTSAIIFIHNCIFVDITYKCKVATYLTDLMSEIKIPTAERKSVMITLLHYALTNGSNCSCNCEELCQAFNELNLLIENTEIDTNCGCQ